MIFKKLGILGVVLFIIIFSIFSFSNQETKTIEKNSEIIANKKPLPKNWPWRGVTIVTHNTSNIITKNSLDRLKNENVNFVRLRISLRKHVQNNKNSVEEAIDEVFKYSDSIISWAQQNDIVVLISHSDFPLNPNLNVKQMNAEFWKNQDLLNESITFSKQIVSHFNHWDNVVGYEFFAEPVIQTDSGPIRPSNWNSHYLNILSAVREISDKYLLYSPGPWGGPEGYKTLNNPIPDDKIIYNFHFYDPHIYTHQGTKKRPNKYEYPGLINGKLVDKNSLKQKMSYAINWAKKNDKLLFVGEFSASSKAPNKEQYIKDLIDLFEENNLSYAYFSFNGWNGWSYPFKDFNSTNESKKDQNKNSTLSILKSNWSKNRNN